MSQTLPRTIREEIAWLRWRCRVAMGLGAATLGDPCEATFVIAADAARRARLSQIIAGVAGMCLAVAERDGVPIARIEVRATHVAMALDAYEVAQDVKHDPDHGAMGAGPGDGDPEAA